MSTNLDLSLYFNAESVSAISLSVLFNSLNPMLWFFRIENYFLAHHIVSQYVKYGYVSTMLPDNIAGQVGDALVNEDPKAPYDVPKQAVIKATSLSDHQTSRLYAFFYRTKGNQ